MIQNLPKASANNINKTSLKNNNSNKNQKNNSDILLFGTAKPIKACI